MGQEDGRFVALAAGPFEARYRGLGTVVSAAAWHDLVLAGLTSPLTFGPSPEPTAELEALANGPAPGDGPDVPLVGWEAATMVLAAAAHRCDGRSFRPDGPLADLLARDHDVSAALAATADPQASASAWAGLRRALAGPVPDAPWWLAAALGGSWQFGVTAPEDVAALAHELARTGAVAAVAARAGAYYDADLRNLLAYFAEAARDGRWIIGTVAGT